MIILNKTKRNNIEYSNFVKQYRNMKQKIIIVGGGASGKDTLRKRLENKGYVFGVNHTTRPKRILELHGVDYNFISDKDFSDMIDRSCFLEYQEHNGWKYGITKEVFNKSNLFIFSPKSFEKLSKTIKDDCFCILLDINSTVRYKRLLKRFDADSAERRLLQDLKDINSLDMSEFDCIITNENF